VRDDANLLPRMPQKESNIACIQIGQEDRVCYFNAELAKHMALDVHTMSASADVQSIQNVVSQIEGDRVIISLLGMSRFVKNRFGVTAATVYCLQELKKAGKKPVLVVFGNAYSVPLFKDVSTLIVAYEEDIDAQQAAALVVSGKIKATGILPVLQSNNN
jgi:hypothetical protein